MTSRSASDIAPRSSHGMITRATEPTVYTGLGQHDVDIDVDGGGRHAAGVSAGALRVDVAEGG